MAISIVSAAYGNVVGSGGLNKIYMPVSSASLIYSHFDHVSGVAASKGQGGVSITKLQILNSLIDHLSNIKGEDAVPQRNASPEEIDFLIENYQSQIRQSIESARNSSYGLTGIRLETGALFSLSV